MCLKCTKESSSLQKIIWSFLCEVIIRCFLRCFSNNILWNKKSSRCRELWNFIDTGLSSVAQSCLTLWDPMDCSTPGFPVYHQLPELAQTHVHWVSDAIQPFHPLLLSSPSAFNLSQHQGILQWVGSSHHMAKVLELQLQHQILL